MSSDISGTDAGTFKETSLFADFCFSPGFCFLVFAAPPEVSRKETPPRSAASSETSSRLRLASSRRTVASSTSSRESLAPFAFALVAASSPLLSSSSSLLSSCSAVTASKPCSAQTTPRFSTIPVKYSTSPCANTKSGPTARINVSPRRTDTRYKPGSPRRPEPATVLLTAADHGCKRAPTIKSSETDPPVAPAPAPRFSPRARARGSARCRWRLFPSGAARATRGACRSCP